MPRKQGFFSDPIRVIKVATIAATLGGTLFLILYATLERDFIESEILEVPTIAASVQPVKTRAVDPGGMQIAHQDKLVFDLLNNPSETEVAPEPEKAELSEADAIQKQIEMLNNSQAEVVEEVKVVAVKAAPVATIPEPEIKYETATAEPKGYGVQLASFLDVPTAEKAVKSYSAKYAAELAGLTPMVKKSDLGAKGIRYRAWFIGVADRSAANAVCAKLSAKGQGCFPAKN